MHVPASIQDLNLGTCIDASRIVHAAGMHLLITSQIFSVAHDGLRLRHVLPSQVASIQGGLAADTTSDASYAAQAGIPLPAGYSPPPASSATPALNPNPCLGEDPGYSTGLTTAFYGDYIGKGQFDTTSPTFERCAILIPPDRLSCPIAVAQLEDCVTRRARSWHSQAMNRGAALPQVPALSWLTVTTHTHLCIQLLSYAHQDIHNSGMCASQV